MYSPLSSNVSISSNSFGNKTRTSSVVRIPPVGVGAGVVSGTLGAALEAAIHKVPAIAVSYCIGKITDLQVEKKKIIMGELELAAALAEKAAEYVLGYGMPRDVDIISINVPDRAESNEAEITSLSYKGYGDIHANEEDAYKIASWALSSYSDDQPGTDLYAIREKKRISITPIKIQLLHNKKGLEDFSKFLVS